MGKPWEKIGEYIEKNKKSKLNKSEVKEVVSILKEGLAYDSTFIDDNIEIILDLHYAVSIEFIKNVFINLEDQIKTKFITKFLRSDKIVKNANSFGIHRCLVIVNELLKAESTEFIHAILKACVIKANGKDGGQKAGELLSKVCFEDTKNKIFLLDYSEWPETELRNLSFWLGSAITHISDEEIIANYHAFIEKYRLPKSKKADVDVVNAPILKIDDCATKTTLKIETKNANSKKEYKEKIVVLAGELQFEAERIVTERVRLLEELEEVKRKLEKSNHDNEGLSLQLSEMSGRNSQLQEQIKIKEIKIIDAEKKITEMNERLEYAYKADKRAENQELASLKNDLVKQLKLDYDAFQKLASKEPAQYHVYYEGLVGIIENIFDALRRKGIRITQENEG